MNNGMRKYKKEIESLVAWCKDIYLFVNSRKMKELVIDFWKQGGVHAPACTSSVDITLYSALFSFAQPVVFIYGMICPENMSNKLCHSISVHVTIINITTTPD